MLATKPNLMRTENSHSGNWDDLVFENRNKEYGAYVLRKAYPKNVAEGMMLSVFFMAAVFIIPQIVSYFTGKVPLPIVKPPEPPTLWRQTPSIILEAKPRQVATQVVKPASNAAPVVTTMDVQDQKPDPEPSSTTSSSSTAVEGGVGSVTEATGIAVDELPVIVQPAAVDHAEIMPAFPGGVEAMMKFIQKKLKYPRYEMQNGIEGKVFVQFVVNYEGRVVDVKVMRGFSPNCDREASRVIAMLPDWKPGLQNKMPVSVRMILPINFRLTN